ncbi:transcriptional regulator [Brevibacillus parabrevis]|uniref:transcriptional regulator n=1 Tax=Brevibacillus parabrevis TaxID=54914 RepID=UPI002380745B|nr:transcriptional regulator [Brevibacillus parabrevis]MED2253510.1 transcriptional regulator [Brevibacillus parabrevis]WDV95751.1 transcriptional regulator [Brevibacillus parabrevis]
MNIQVAFIGPHDLIPDVIQVGQKFPAITLIPCGYRNVEETGALLRQCEDKANVFLFAGPIPYQLVQDIPCSDKPRLFLPHNGTSLYRVIFQMLRDQKVVGNKLRCSIDILQREEIEERLEELGLVTEEVYVQEYVAGQEAEEIMAFHLDLWQAGKVDAILTCVTTVYKQLVEQGIPCYRIIPARSAIYDCLHQAELEGRSALLSDNQIAIVMISLESLAGKKQANEYDTQRKKLAVQQIMIDLGEEIQALMNWSAQDKIRFVTTRGVIERATQGFRHYPWLEQITGKLNAEISMGIGLGVTANEAEGKAREALFQAKASKDQRCYIAMQDGSVIGLSGTEILMEYSVRSADPWRLQLARKTGVSVGTINRLISYCEGYGRFTFTAAELAEGFGITMRSARRLLGKLEVGQAVRVIGEEQPIGRGRPRQLYHLQVPGVVEMAQKKQPFRQKKRGASHV